MSHRLLSTLMQPLLMAAAALLAGFAAPAAAAQQDVEVALEQFGVAGFYRPGDFTGIQVRVTSNLDEPINAQVVWELPEGLGDIQDITRTVALGPGQPVSVWLYGKLLPSADNSTVYTVRVYEDRDGDRGSELGAVRIDAAAGATRPNLVDRRAALIGFVGGTSNAGLTYYNTLDPSSRFPVTGHEFIETAVGIPPVALPDRFEGYDSFRALVWSDAQPGALRDAQARAIRDWVKRGGQFIILLPQAGNDWQLGAAPITALHDLLPQSPPRIDDATITELLPVISKRQRITAQANVQFQIRVFDTIDNRYEPLLALPDERVVGIERRFGHGRITVLGIDLASNQLNALGLGGDAGGLVHDPEMVWNIVLGKRQDVLTPQQVDTLAKATDPRKINTTNRSNIDLGAGKLVLEQISLSSQAFAGIGLAFVLFVGYWLLAGPVGFGLLKGAKKARHAWVAFALTSAAFTGIAWVGVKLFSQKDTVVRHLTFLDYIAEGPAARPDVAEDAPDAPASSHFEITSWFTIFLPGYGAPPIQVGDPSGDRQLVVPFTAPGSEVGAFANVDHYTVNVDRPGSFRTPARSTTKEMYARYIGPLSQSPEDFGRIDVTEPIVVQGGAISSGKIIHSFPKPLTNVKVILVKRGRNLPKQYRDATGISGELTPASHGALPLSIDMFSVPGSIAVLDDFSLVGSGSFGRFDTHITGKYQGVKSDGQPGMSGAGSVGGRADDYLFMLSFYDMITPPEYQNAEISWDDRQRPVTIERHLGRELDMSVWLTRPCIIIYGELEDVRTPLPLTVDGSAPESGGKVIVRMVYPLPVEPADVKPAERIEE